MKIKRGDIVISEYGMGEVLAITNHWLIHLNERGQEMAISLDDEEISVPIETEFDVPDEEVDVDVESFDDESENWPQKGSKMEYNLKIGNNFFLVSKNIEKIINYLQFHKKTASCSLLVGKNKSYSGSAEEIIQMLEKDFSTLILETSWQQRRIMIG